MIVFDLRCSPEGHVFEAWFGSSDDYDSQQARGLVQCPLCGAGEVEKAVMAPRVAALLAKELGYNENWESTQVAAFSELAGQYLLNKNVLLKDKKWKEPERQII